MTARSLRTLATSILTLVTLVGCASELRLRPVSPPGYLLETEVEHDAVQIEQEGIVVRISKVSMWDGDRLSQRSPGVKADIRIENRSSSFGVVLKTRGLFLSVDGVPLTLWPYLTFLEPSGSTAEMGDVEEILVLQGGAMHFLATLKACPPMPECVRPPYIDDHIIAPKEDALFHIAEINLIRDDETVSVGARFVPEVSDLIRFKLRRLLHSS